MSTLHKDCSDSRVYLLVKSSYLQRYSSSLRSQSKSQKSSEQSIYKLASSIPRKTYQTYQRNISIKDSNNMSNRQEINITTAPVTPFFTMTKKELPYNKNFLQSISTRNNNSNNNTNFGTNMNSDNKILNSKKFKIINRDVIGFNNKELIKGVRKTSNGSSTSLSSLFGKKDKIANKFKFINSTHDDGFFMSRETWARKVKLPPKEFNFHKNRLYHDFNFFNRNYVIRDHTDTIEYNGYKIKNLINNDEYVDKIKRDLFDLKFDKQVKPYINL